MKRRLLALAGLLVLAGLAGCTTGSAPPTEEELVGDANYDWNADANASVVVNDTEFTAVYAVENRSTFDVFRRDGLGQERAISVSAVRFRYPNGTVLTVRNSTLAVEQGGGRTTITLPGNATGQLAFTAPRFGKSFGLPTFVDGSYAVTLPPNSRVGIPLLGQVSPPGFSTTVGDDGRMTVTWENVDVDQFHVSWYLQRDVYIFGGLVLIGILLAVGGTLYYYRQIKLLEARRKEVGLDVDYDDDDPRDEGPPPGMR